MFRGLIGIALGLFAASTPSSAFTTQNGAPPWAPPTVAPVEASGQVYLNPPSRLPDPWLENTPPSLDAIREHLAIGDHDRARLLAQDLVADKKWGRDRDAAWLVLGLLYREQGYNNLASEAFTKVRSSKGPLASWGAWYEAEQDHLRGRESVAIRECTAYRERFPSGHHADACLRLIARSEAAIGRITAARETAVAYDRAHPQAPIAEQVELVAARWMAEHHPERAPYLLKRLALDHDTALTGRVAEEELARLAADGIADATLPDDDETLKRRAVLLRESRRMTEAWALYQELARRAEDDPRLQGWVQGEATTFGWRTHQWDFLVDVYAERYEQNPEGENAWSVFRAYVRAGRHAEAATFAKQARSRHGKTRRWASSTTNEEVARAALMGGDARYGIELYDKLAAKGGWRGRRTAFYAALGAFLAGDLEDAEKRFTAIVDRRRTYAEAARYWRSRTREQAGDTEGAAADRAALLGQTEDTWYTVLARQRQGELPRFSPYARDGRWPGTRGEPAPASPSWERLTTEALPVASWSPPRAVASRADWSQLRWPLTVVEPPAVPDSSSHILWTHPDLPPSDYAGSTLFDPGTARGALWTYASRHEKTWPELAAIADLARAGLYDLSGPLFSEFFERRRRNVGGARSAGAWLSQGEWRNLFLATRDHHHTARYLYGLEKTVDQPGLMREAQRLGWPLAHAVPAWQQARESNVDPQLVMALMRVESTYNSVAVSKVGARGAMQIMPRTGYLLANLRDDTWFTAGDLEDPVLSVRYGIGYLGLLLDRFDGVFPLAVAAYNGGPFAVGAWVKGAGPEAELDVLVELIPYQETRRYVKSVSAAYATYLSLYAPEGTELVLPTHPRGDDASIVDF